MSRPRKERKVECKPNSVYFKPRGIPLMMLEEVILTVDELESLRLRALNKMSQKEGAEKMGIHQSTFHRALASAMEHIADALVNGKAIRIEGGTYSIEDKKIDSTVWYCKCPKCEYSVIHKPGIPCMNLFCPNCSTRLEKSERK